jgi:hypothetical protein
MSRLWDEFDALAFNLKEQAHSGVGEAEGRALLDVAKRIEQALERFADIPTDTTPMQNIGIIEPGEHYLLRATEPITAEDASRIKDQLRVAFPDSEFSILNSKLEPVDAPASVTRSDLVHALNTVEAKADEQWRDARAPDTRLLMAAVGASAGMLREALTQTGDGAAAPTAAPPSTPAGTDDGEQTAESATPTAAPSPPYPAYQKPCGRPHPWMDSVWCSLKPHPDMRHEHQGADQYRTVVAWSDSLQAGVTPAECLAKKPGHGDTIGRTCFRPPHTEGAHLDGAGWWL